MPAEIGPHLLGRKVQHDPRSWGFRAQLAPTLRTRHHRHWGPVLDQGNVGACTGFATAQALNTVPLRRGRRLLTADDARSLYSTATTLDAWPGTWPPDDTGSSGLAVAKAAQQAGLIGGYRHAFGIDEVLAALVLTPLIVGTSWTTDMFKPDQYGRLHPTGSVAGGHEYALVGINVREEHVVMFNSWGPRWGLVGRATIAWDDLAQLLADNGDATVLAL